MYFFLNNSLFKNVFQLLRTEKKTCDELSSRYFNFLMIIKVYKKLNVIFRHIFSLNSFFHNIVGKRFKHFNLLFVILNKESNEIYLKTTYLKKIINSYIKYFLHDLKIYIFFSFSDRSQLASLRNLNQMKWEHCELSHQNEKVGDMRNL